MFLPGLSKNCHFFSLMLCYINCVFNSFAFGLLNVICEFYIYISFVYRLLNMIITIDISSSFRSRSSMHTIQRKAKIVFSFRQRPPC